MTAIKTAKPVLNLFDDDTVKWTHEGKEYCLRIMRDDGCEDPREYDEGTISIMACWHNCYRLGNKIADDSPEDFWRRLVRENVSDKEILDAITSGKLEGIRIEPNEEDPDLVDILEMCYYQWPFGKTEPEEVIVCEGVSPENMALTEYLVDDLTIRHCMILMEPYAEWMPLWLYDHSGITMSCGSRSGQYADPWDSGQVGWILMLKETAMKNLCGYVLDENGERIRVEHKHEGYPSTWSHLTCPLTDETWRARAIEVMEADVRIYDQYLTGDVYGFKLYEKADNPDDGDPDVPGWTEMDSCWNFYGSNLYENGILDMVADGLEEALESGEYEEGEITIHNSFWIEL